MSVITDEIYMSLIEGFINYCYIHKENNKT